jgi:hypothetical protein
MICNTFTNDTPFQDGDIQLYNDCSSSNNCCPSSFLDSFDTRVSAVMAASSSSFPTKSGKCFINKGGKNAGLERRTTLKALAENKILRQSDVLLNCGNDNFLCRLLPGTLAYAQRIHDSRPVFRESSDSEKQHVIRTIMESVWSNEGRFLTILEDINAVIVVENDKLVDSVTKDLACSNNPFPAVFAKAKRQFHKKKKQQQEEQQKQRRHRHNQEKEKNTKKMNDNDKKKSTCSGCTTSTAPNSESNKTNNNGSHSTQRKCHPAKKKFNPRRISQQRSQHNWAKEPSMKMDIH